MTKRRSLLPPLLAVSALLVASCGDDDAGSTDTDGPTDTEASTETEAPTETDAPEETEAPLDSEAPTESEVPADTEVPAETEVPEGTDAPAGGVVVDQAAIDTAADLFLLEQEAQGVTAFYVAISDPVNGEFASVYGTSAVGGPDATLDDNFRIGSISKTFTATVILQLIEEGALSLDDTVGDLLPDLAAANPPITDLTVRDLLAMQSGLSDYLNKVDTVVPVIAQDPSTVWAPEELIAAGVEAGADGAGNAGYSTTNFIILQLIAESIGGAPLADLIEERITSELGLDSTYLPPNDDTTLPEPATHGYVDGGCIDELAEDGATVEPGTDVTDWNASYGQGGGGMTGTIGDLLGWAESGAGNTLLDDATVDQRLEIAMLPEGIGYGLGIMGVGPWIGHEGEAIGWETLSVLEPETGVSVAVAANGCGGLFSGFLDFIGALYPDSF